MLLAAVPVLAGLLVAVVGLLGMRESLPRNRFAGVRTSATLRSDEAFRVANRVAGAPTAVAGLVGVLGGLAALVMPGTGGLVAGVTIGLVGLVAIAVGAGLLGHRAALAVPDRRPLPSAGCGGCACGNCELLPRG